MNKTNFKRVCRLYNEGLTTETAIVLIISLSRSNEECAKYILKLMHEVVFPRWFSQHSRGHLPTPDGFRPR